MGGGGSDRIGRQSVPATSSAVAATGPLTLVQRSHSDARLGVDGYGAEMGGSSSRELEAAQLQVRKLTRELEKVSRKVAQAAPASSALQAAAEKSAAEKAAAAAAAAEQKAREELLAKDRELEMTAMKLKGMASELPKIKEVAQKNAQELESVKREKAQKDSQLKTLKDELKASKEELEALFGKLKFAEAEGAAVRKLKAELSEKETLVEQQRAAAEESARAIADANAAILAEQKESGVPTEAVHHPVFGQLLHDYGHKKLFLGSPTTLWAGTVLWERQRAFRQERAALIATAKGRSQERGWPGSISIVEMASEGDAAEATGGGGKGGRKTKGRGRKSAADDDGSDDGSNGGGSPASSSLGMLIDGQHRLGAAHLLSQRGKLSGALSAILVEVYPPMEEANIKELFTEINKAEPVLLVDLPDGGASETDNAVLTIAAETLRDKYPAMFKPSHGCRPPHVNVDVMREEMHRAELLSREKLTTADQLVSWLEERNAELAARDDGQWNKESANVKSNAALAKALAKARTEGFYLGLTWDWVREVK